MTIPILWYGALLLDNTVCIVALLSCLSGCFHHKKRTIMHQIMLSMIGVLSLLITLCFYSPSCNAPYLLLLLPLLCPIGCQALLLGSFKEHLLISLSLCSSFCICSLCFKFLLSFFVEGETLPLPFEDVLPLVCSLLLVVALFLSMTFLLRNLYRQKQQILTNKETFPILIISLAAQLATLILLHHFSKVSPYLHWFFVIALWLAVAFNLHLKRVISYFHQRHELEHKIELLQESQQIYREQFEVSELYFNRARKAKHDLINFGIGLQALLEQGHYEQAVDQAKQLAESVYETDAMVHSNYVFLDAIVNAKLSQAIRLKCVLYTTYQFELGELKEMEVGRVIGNLLDNAITYLQTCSAPHKELSLKMVNHKDYLLIEVKNTIVGSILKSNPQLRSTKNDLNQHGLGLSSVYDIVQQNHGELHFQERYGQLICNIMLLSEK